MNKRQLVKELSALLTRLELVSDDATYQSELTGAYVKDAIANLYIALGHVNDKS
ncbi:hypothetical protein [Leuconostoc gelidum]|uniref:hypothetical protein n=1 Tax=Leuconostoc gelidum TaxID=1244 RepID=UPI001CC79F9F|nr:hypothetical protein [Leuconostoc gelidum]MBZ5985996.1 hypothetical protein [Leuconostoc gelidum subsp. gelidum]